MPATEKLYSEFPRTTGFRARVVASGEADAGGYDVVLDRTAFYPESGGQLCDGGTLAGHPVRDVRERGEQVVHRLDSPVDVGEEVEGLVDWDRRFDHMQQHTGQHVLSRAFIACRSLRTVSFHMGNETCTIDLDGGVDESAARDAETIANSVIEENRTVHARVVPVGEIDDETIRGKVPEGVALARLVSVDGFDTVPCCGTHVESAGELRLVKVLKWEKVRAGTRVHFVAGRRALADYAFKHAVTADLSNRMTTSVGELVAGFEKISADAKAGRRAIKNLSVRLSVLEKDLLVAGAREVAGVKMIARLLPDADSSYLGTLAGELRNVDNVVAFVGAGDGGVVCVASDDVEVELAKPATDLARAMGGRGGGKAGYARLQLANVEAVKQFIEAMQNDVEKRIQ